MGNGELTNNTSSKVSIFYRQKRRIKRRFCFKYLKLQDAIFCHVVFHGGEDIVVFFGLL